MRWRSSGRASTVRSLIVAKRDRGAVERRADRLGARRLHPRRRGRRADGRAGDGHPAQRHGRRRGQPLDPGHDRLRHDAGAGRRRAGRWWTSTPPAASATRSRCRWRRWSRRAGRRCRSCPGAGSGTPAAPWTSWSRYPVGGRRCRSRRSPPSSPTSGAVICATTPTLAPADRKLYALRDVTGTVESIPLIASSIMSKKIAEGTGGLVLDVKVGSGAFMKTPERARELAATMVRIGGDHGLPTTALLTDMSAPLGRAVGNALEVAESVEVLRGGGPADVVELTVALAREMLRLAGLSDVDPAAVLASGAAYPVWERMIAAQGGDPAARAADRGARGAGAGRPQRCARPLRRAGGRGGRLAAGGRPGPAVRRGAGRRRGAAAGRAGGAGRGRAAAAGAAHRHPGRGARGARRAGGEACGRRRAGHPATVAPGDRRS